MRNEDHGLSVAGQLAQQFEQAICLAGREDRGRFVENDELGALEENPENFHPLTFADRKVAYESVRPHLEPVAAAQFGNTPCDVGRSP